jgi:hypothetical protein
MNSILVTVIRDISRQLSTLSALIEKEEHYRKAFEVAVSDTLALPMSLDEFSVEWAALADNIAIDAVMCKMSWKASAKFCREVPEMEQHWTDMLIKGDDIVFEDKSYIQTVSKLNEYGTYFEYIVEIDREALVTIDYQAACDYLWENHAKTGYGVE